MFLTLLIWRRMARFNLGSFCGILVALALTGGACFLVLADGLFTQVYLQFVVGTLLPLCFWSPLSAVNAWLVANKVSDFVFLCSLVRV